MTSVAIIGAGFSGAATAIAFLRHAKAGDHLFLINRSGEMAQGLAYGTNSPDHLLNVPAGNMAVMPDDPDSFLNYCRNIDPTIESSSFVSRAIYGQYLVATLRDAELNSKGACTRIVDEVIEIQRTGELNLVILNKTPQIDVDHIVLAFGNFPPETPAPLSHLVNHPSYIGDPWKKISVDPLTQPLKILVLGCGLTAIDVILKFKQNFPDANFTLLSRRGLLPQPHRDQIPSKRYSGSIEDILLTPPHTVLGYLRSIRKEMSSHPDNWREIINTIRPITPELWQNLSNDEQRKFIRHLQPYWDSHRHRVAPKSYQKFHSAMRDGSITTIKGRIISASADDIKIQYLIRKRSHASKNKMRFDLVINCTGPSTKLRNIDSLLTKSLIKAGIIREDPHSLGLITAGTAIVNSKGEPLTWISYIGPMLKASFWEATAVPELRKHAVDLAHRIHKSPYFTDM